MDYWHITLATKGRRALPDEASVLAAVEVVVRVGGNALLLFCVVDDHLHIVVCGTRSEVGRLAQRVLLALRAAIPQVRFDPAHIEPVENRRHLYRLVPYVLRQTEHHDLPWHPTRWAGSCFPDLVGARVLPSFGPEALHRALPRLNFDEILDSARASRRAVDPIHDDALPGTGPLAVLGAAAAAVGLRAIRGNTPREVAGRRAAARILIRGGWTTKQVAEHLQVSHRAARRLVDQELDPRIERAVRMQITLAETIPSRRLLAGPAAALPG